MHVARASSYTASLLLLLLLLSLRSLLPPVSSQSTSKWQTLSGNAPLVVARGGFSGIFPDSSLIAYQMAMLLSVSDVVLWCDVQLTKSGTGICAPHVNLENSTDISAIYPNSSSLYSVNGMAAHGWYSVDFTDDELWPNVTLTQGILSRTNRFDGNGFPIQQVEDVAALKPQGLWLNIQHDAFFTQHNLSMRSYLLSVTRRVVVNYISSPEVAFLKNIASRFNPNITKLVLRFLGQDDIEPSTNQTYSSLLGNLTFIKTFASGILIPKSYIWPVDASNYLEPRTSIVSDAHKAGLQVYASEFYNDALISYNYSYDPVNEYLYHIDNGDFSVDGVLSDFPITPSEARDCFAHLGKTAPDRVNLSVITKNGASGDYPGCTDLAYQKAISDGADVIDCSVQMSKDGTPFCMSSINLIESTNAAQSSFSNLAVSVPELNAGTGIYSFSLTWSDIQTLSPVISSPYAQGYKLFRNPKYRNAGKFLTLSDFLALAKNSSSLSGVLISIENAAYLIEKQKMPVIDAVLNALSKAGYDNQTAKKVMIQSSNSAVLMKFKDTNFELVYMVDENIGDALVPAVDDIKSFAHSVVISKMSVIDEDLLFLTNATDVVPKLQSANLSVYVQTFSNEFVSQAWDFFSDATVEVNNYVASTNIKGVITDFPETSARYKRNRCSSSANAPAYMSPVQPGGLLNLIKAEQYLPPAEAPNPPLTVSDVVEAPLPSVSSTPTSSPTTSPGGGTTATPKSSAEQPKIVTALLLSHFAILGTILLLS